LSETSPTYRDGVRAGLGFVLPTIAVATSFGVLAEPVIGAIPAIVMSVIVYAGSAQVAALTVLAGGGGAGAAVTAGLLMNTRFLPMGLALGPSLPGGAGLRALQGQAVVDPSWALANRGGGHFDRRLLIGSTIPQFVAWVSGTAVGVFAGNVIGDPATLGLDALFPAFYLALLVQELRGRRPLVAALLGAAITIALLPFAPPGLPVIAATSAALIALWRP
jgi:predicted branched-subunit amino acid permease